MLDSSSTLLRFFPVPRYLESPSAGLDLSPAAVRFVVLERSKAGLVPKAFGTRPLTMNMGSEELAHHEELRKTLIALKREHRLTHVRVTIPEEKAYIFTTDLSPEAYLNAREAVGFKIEENVPIDPSNAVYDYMPVEREENRVPGEPVRVVVTVVPQDVIDNYLELMQEVGLTVDSFLTQNQALARAVVPNGECVTNVLVNAHDGMTDISIVRGRAVLYSSTVKATNESVIERIQKVVTFWRGRQRTHGADEARMNIVLAGSDAETNDLHSSLTRYLDLPVVRANVWTNCFSLERYVPQIPRSESLAYGAAIGCALPDTRSC